MRDRYSIAVLVAANLLPLAGVLLWDWDVFFLLLLFWCENVIIGVFGISRLIVARDSENAVDGLFLPIFFLSHGWSFIENYMGQREHENLKPGAAMALPYRRMMITHVALLAGGFFLIERGQPLVGLVLLVILKIVLDVTFHRREHKRLTESIIFESVR